MLIKMDQWILGKFEFIADKFAQFTGKNNFFLARILLCLWAATLIILGSNIGIIAIMFFLLLTFTYSGEKIVESQQAVGLANTFKITWFPARAISNIFILLIIPALFIGVPMINHFPILFYWAFSYLLSCDTKPPVKSRIRQWLESLMPKPALIPATIAVKP